MHLLLVLVLCRVVTGTIAIWPQPLSLTSGHEVLWVDAPLQATFHCSDQLIFESRAPSVPLYRKLTVAAAQAALKLASLVPYEVINHATFSGALSERSIVEDAVHES